MDSVQGAMHGDEDHVRRERTAMEPAEEQDWHLLDRAQVNAKSKGDDESQLHDSSSSSFSTARQASRLTSDPLRHSDSRSARYATLARSDPRPRRMTALDGLSSGRESVQEHHDVSGRRSVSHEMISNGRLSSLRSRGERVELQRPASQAQRRTPLPDSFRGAIRRPYQSMGPEEYGDQSIGDTSGDSITLYQRQRSGNMGSLSRARADVLINTTPNDQRRRPSSRSLSRSGGREAAFADEENNLRSDGKRGETNRHEDGLSGVRSRIQPEVSPSDLVRQRRAASGSSSSARLSARDALRPSSRSGTRRQLARDVFDDAPPLPSTSNHPLSPVYNTMELQDETVNLPGRSQSSLRGRTSVLDDVRARIDDLTGGFNQRPVSRASSHFSRDPSYQSSTPSYSHATSSATSVQPATEPRKMRMHHEHALAEHTPEHYRPRSSLRREGLARPLSSRASVMGLRQPITPDTAPSRLRRQASSYASSALKGQSAPMSAGASSASNDSVPLHARNLLSSMDALERHFLGILDIETAQRRIPAQADLVYKFQETARLALDINSDLRAVAQHNLENQIDAEIGVGGLERAGTFAKMEKSLGSLVRRSDEHVRLLTESLMAMTRIEQPVNGGGMTVTRSADEIAPRALSRSARYTGEGSQSYASDNRRMSFDLRRGSATRPDRDLLNVEQYASSRRSTESSGSRTSRGIGARSRQSTQPTLDATRRSYLAPSPTPSSTTARIRQQEEEGEGQVSSTSAAASRPTVIARRKTLDRLPSLPPTQMVKTSSSDTITIAEQSRHVQDAHQGPFHEQDVLPKEVAARARRQSKSSNVSIQSLGAGPSLSPSKAEPSPASVSTISVAHQAPASETHVDGASGAVEGLLLHFDGSGEQNYSNSDKSPSSYSSDERGAPHKPPPPSSWRNSRLTGDAAFVQGYNDANSAPKDLDHASPVQSHRRQESESDASTSPVHESQNQTRSSISHRGTASLSATYAMPKTTIADVTSPPRISAGAAPLAHFGQSAKSIGRGLSVRERVRAMEQTASSANQDGQQEAV